MVIVFNYIWSTIFCNYKHIHTYKHIIPNRPNIGPMIEFWQPIKTQPSYSLFYICEPCLWFSFVCTSWRGCIVLDTWTIWECTKGVLNLTMLYYINICTNYNSKSCMWDLWKYATFVLVWCTKLHSIIFSYWHMLVSKKNQQQVGM